MAEQFYTILTAIGKAKIANSAALGEKVELTHLALGDGGGSYYNPTEDQTALRNEVWRGAISTVDIDAENSNWIAIQTVVPSQHGGFMIREAGVFDDEGDLIAVGKYPETYKPLAADGSIKDLVVRMILEVGNTSSVQLKVDPTIVLATKKDINDLAGAGRTTQTVKGNADSIAALQQAFAGHLADNANKAHGGFKGALVSLSVHQSIPNNTTTLISWGVENYDDLSIWSSDNPTKLVVPNGISKVIVKAGVFWAVSSAGYRSVQILKNGAGFAGMGSDHRNAVERSGANLATSVITVSPGDYFELQVTQNSGGSLDLVALSQTWFSMEVIE